MQVKLRCVTLAQMPRELILLFVVVCRLLLPPVEQLVTGGVNLVCAGSVDIVGLSAYHSSP